MKNYQVWYSTIPDEGSTSIEQIQYAKNVAGVDIPPYTHENFIENKISEEAALIGGDQIKASSPEAAYELFINNPIYGDVLPRSILVDWWWFGGPVIFDNHVNAAKKKYDEKFPKIAPCSDCGKEISKSATACPQCGCVTPVGHHEKRLRREAETATIKAIKKPKIPLLGLISDIIFLVIVGFFLSPLFGSEKELKDLGVFIGGAAMWVIVFFNMLSKLIKL
jgi:hypothetical protein